MGWVSRFGLAAIAVVAVMAAVATPTMFIVGAWAGGAAWFITGAVLLPTSIGLCVLAFALVEEFWGKAMPRAHRRQLREAQARIALDKAIADAEKEAGLR